MVGELSRRREKNAREIRQQQRRAYFAQVRGAMLLVQKQDFQTQQSMQLLLMGYGALQSCQSDPLNIFKNLEHITREALVAPRSNTLLQQISFGMYLALASYREVVTWMVEQRPVEEWGLLLKVREQYGEMEECLLQIMEAFLNQLQLTYHSKQSLQAAAIQQIILSQHTTNILCDIGFPLNPGSNYYPMMVQYIALVPSCQLPLLAHKGYIVEAGLAPNRTVFLLLVERIETVCQEHSQMGALLKQFQEFNECI